MKNFTTTKVQIFFLFCKKNINFAKLKLDISCQTQDTS